MVRAVHSGELVNGDRRVLVSYGEETFCFVGEEERRQFLLFPADYRTRAQLPARLTGSQRLGQPPKTLSGIAKAARERCMQQLQGSEVSGNPLMAEEGLAELRDTLKDALTYIEVQQHTLNLPLGGRCTRIHRCAAEHSHPYLLLLLLLPSSGQQHQKPHGFSCVHLHSWGARLPT